MHYPESTEEEEEEELYLTPGPVIGPRLIYRNRTGVDGAEINGGSWGCDGHGM